jgi:hypothetical protein
MFELVLHENIDPKLSLLMETFERPGEFIKTPNITDTLS